MLFLRLPAGDSASTPPDLLPLVEESALAFERALLAANKAERQQELITALAADRHVACWALRAAEISLGQTVNRLEEASAWLSDNLAPALAESLHADVPVRAQSFANAVEWRLPRLAESLASSARHLAEFDQRLEREKLESLKELAYGASHEINNPLANIAARAQTLLEDESDPERQRKLAAIHRQAMRAHEMIADLMLFARPPKLRIVECDLVALVHNVVLELRGLADEFKVRIDCENATEPIVAPADATQIAVAVGAIIKNAIEAARNGGQVDVSVRISPADAPAFAEIVVSDDGPGLSDEVRRHIFDPFFSGREAGRGLGFGASKCWRIVTDHGGRVLVHSRSPSTEFTIQLPLAAPNDPCRASGDSN